MATVASASTSSRITKQAATSVIYKRPPCCMCTETQGRVLSDIELTSDYKNKRAKLLGLQNASDHFRPLHASLWRSVDRQRATLPRKIQAPQQGDCFQGTARRGLETDPRAAESTPFPLFLNAVGVWSNMHNPAILRPQFLVVNRISANPPPCAEKEINTTSLERCIL